MSSKKIVILADSLSEMGGAEKTLANYAQSLLTEHDVIFMDTEDLSPIHFDMYSDHIWIVGNFYTLIAGGILDVFVERVRTYYIISFDYLFCPSRNLEYYRHLHGAELTYIPYVRRVDEFLGGAKCLFFMSEVQRAKYLQHLKLIKPNRCVVLGSLISQEDLKCIERHVGAEKMDLYCVYHQDTWQKGLEVSVAYCKDHNIPYEVLPALDYPSFIKKLSSYKGLVFLPRGGDTAPRLIIEAKLLGLELQINPNVEHAEESWFLEGRSSIISHMTSLPDKFLNIINEG